MLVKPDAVKMDSIISHSKSLQLSWFSPVPYFLPQYTLVYNIQVSERNGDHNKISSNITASNLTVIYTVNDLTPYTEYLIIIKCIPYIDGGSKGFWSDSYSSSVWTDPDVPGEVPKVSYGGFRVIHQDKKENWQVEIYWQKIPAETEHGRSLVTRMRVFEIRNDTDVSCSLSDPVFVKTVTDAYSSKLMLLKNKAYAVCIDVHNEVGFNRSSDVWPIIIRPEQQEPMFVDFYAEGLGNEISVKWMPLNSSIRYTVYWCTGSTSYLCNLKHHIAWQHYSNISLSARLTFPSHVTYQSQVVAMSAQYVDSEGRLQTTGMHVTDCIFPLNKDPILPNHIEVPANQYLENSLIVKWRKPKCDTTGYINHFLLLYCKEKHCQETEITVKVPVERLLNADRQEYVIQDLEEGVAYLVKLASVGNKRRSPFSKPIRGYVLKKGLTLINETLVWLAAVTGSILIMACIGYLSNHLRIRFKKKITISLPHNVEDDPDAITSVLCHEGSGYYTIEGEGRLPDDCETLDNIRTPTNQLETHSLLNNDDNQSVARFLTDNDSISSYNRVLDTLVTNSGGCTEYKSPMLDYVDDDFPASEPSPSRQQEDNDRVLDAEGSILSPPRKTSTINPMLSSDSDGVVAESERLVDESIESIGGRLSVNDTLSGAGSPECRGIIHWGHNLGEIRIQQLKDFDNSASSASSSFSGTCANSHLSLDQGASNSGSSNSDSIIVVSSGVASDCSLGISPEALPLDSQTIDGYVVNDPEQTGVLPSGAQLNGTSEASFNSQVTNRAVQKALPVHIQDDSEAASYPSTLPKCAKMGGPFELLPLGGTVKQWQRDSGISTEGMSCGSRDHSDMDSVGDSPYVDHNGLAQLVR